jgi:pimeloyl-ACP methyl ester carboxylesterase
VAALYAGIRPARVAKLVNLEGFGMPQTRPEQAPGRYSLWLDELHERPQLRPYPDFSALEERLRAGNPRLTAERAHFLARHWGRDEGGQVVLRGDPSHKIVNPQLYRYEEALACWRQVAAPVLWVEGAQSETIRRMKMDPAQVAERRAAFRDVRSATVADAGHMLHHDQPRAVAALVEEFLA